MTPVCRDCRHFKGYYSHAEGQVQNCLHPESVTVDIVWGHEYYTEAHVMRRRGACGEGGELFEPHPPTKPFVWWWNR
jgi:hypothetical protein